MPDIRIIAATACLLVMSACTPLTRGFTGSALISTSSPAVTMSSSLPTIAEGRGSAFVYSKEASTVTPDFWMRISGTRRFAEPMSVIAYVVAPDRYEWSPSSSSYVDNEEIGKAVFGGNQFFVSLRAVNPRTDAFTPLFLSPEEMASMPAGMIWLAVRFTDPAQDQWRTKLIMEYREPMPSSVIDGVKVDKQLDNADIRAFIERGRACFAFAYGVPADTSVPTASYLHAPINGQHLGGFIGTLEMKQLPLLFSD